MGRDGFSWFFLSFILVLRHLTVHIDLACILFFCVWQILSSFYFSISFPSAHWDRWIGSCRGTCPRLLSGTNFKKMEKKDWRENMVEWEKDRSSSSTTEPLQLFKWPLSLCTCSLRLGWILKWQPPKRQKMKPMQRAKAECVWLFTSLLW